MKDDIDKLVNGRAAARPQTLTYYYELGPDAATRVTSKTFIGSLFAMVGLDNIADPADADGRQGGYPAAVRRGDGQGRTRT